MIALYDFYDAQTENSKERKYLMKMYTVKLIQRKLMREIDFSVS